VKWLALLVSCLALVVAACGGDDEEEENGGAPAEQPAGDGKTVEVSMKDIQFDPKDATVRKGGTIVWTNDDQVAHDVTKKGGPGRKFKSGTGDLEAGDTYRQTFNTAGKIDYVCTVHPNMTGTITVE
jgi:plastocyanin